MLTKGEDFFPYWTNAFKLCNLFFAIPYEYDDKLQKIKLLVKKRSKRVYHLTLLSHVIYLIVMCLHMQLNHHYMSLPNCLKGLVVIFAYACCVVTRLTFWFYETEGLKMINGFLEFETNLIKKLNGYPGIDRKGSFITKAIFFVGTMSTGTFGIWIFVLLMVDPCTPPYVGSMTPTCLAGENESLSFMSKIPFVIFDSLMWFHVAPPAALTLGNILFGFCLSLQKYLKILFTLSQANGIQSDAMLKILDQYRQLQLLENQMNVTWRTFFTPVGIAVTSNALIFSLYVCIKLNSVIPMPGFAFFPLILIDAMLIIGVDFASAGFVYLKSKDVVMKWRKNYKFGRKSAVKAKANSFPPLKLRFGMNFIDELTALTVLDHCLNQTVSLLLMS